MNTEYSRAEAALRLFAPPQVFLASFFGSLLGGTVLIAWNFHMLGEASKFRTTILIGAVAIPLWLGCLLFLPDTGWDRAWPLLTAVIMSALAYKLQNRSEIVKCYGVRIKPQSMWLTFGVSIASLFVQFLIVLPYFLYRGIAS